MGLLDSAFSSLPRAAQASISSVGDSIRNSVSFNVAGATTKISETVGSLMSTFGGEGGFSKLGANMPTLETMKSAAMRAGSVLVGGSGELVNKQIADVQRSVEGGFSATSYKAATGATTVNDSHIFSLSEIGGQGRVVRFDIMPEVVEARTVQYEAVAPAQFPGAFQKYKGTDSVQWTLNVTLTARNRTEATMNLYYLNTLRGWTMPFFGSNTGAQFPGQLGAPPPSLIMKGLRKLVAGPVPVVITSLNWNWPKDVDYLPTNEPADDGNWVPFPAVMNLAIQLVESWSTSQFNKFSLADYRAGDMYNAFNRPIQEASSEYETTSSASRIGGQPVAPVVNNSNAGAGQSSAAFAAIDPRRLDGAIDAARGAASSAAAAAANAILGGNRGTRGGA